MKVDLPEKEFRALFETLTTCIRENSTLQNKVKDLEDKAYAASREYQRKLYEKDEQITRLKEEDERALATLQGELDALRSSFKPDAGKKVYGPVADAE